jgi:hypothetical protein
VPHTSSGSLLMRHAPSAKMRIKERVRAEAIAKAAAGHRGPLGVSIEEKRQAPPRLISSLAENLRPALGLDRGQDAFGGAGAV